MLSSDEFWKLVHQYDAAVFPMQLVFAAAAVLLVVLVARKPGPGTSALVMSFLAACYTWVGVVFFLIFNPKLSAQMGYFQPILMFVIAGLLCLDAYRGQTQFRWPKAVGHQAVLVVLVAYSIVGYPIMGWVLGHPYAVEVARGVFIWVPILGVFPCPTTIFALALLVPALPRADKKVLIVLLLWAVPSVLGPPMRLYGVYEDVGLFVAGLYGLFMLARRWRPRPPDALARGTGLPDREE